MVAANALVTVLFRLVDSVVYQNERNVAWKEPDLSTEQQTTPIHMGPPLLLVTDDSGTTAFLTTANYITKYSTPEVP